MWQPFVLAMMPSLIWIFVMSWIRETELSVSKLACGILLGASIGFVVWWLEWLIDPMFVTQNRLLTDFLGSLVSAAFVEELLKFICVLIGNRCSGPVAWTD